MASQPVEIFRMMRVQPFHQRPAGVQRDPQMGILLEQVEEQPVAVLIRLLEDAVEIADRLVIVQGEDEANRLCMGSWQARSRWLGVVSDCSRSKLRAGVGSRIRERN